MWKIRWFESWEIRASEHGTVPDWVSNWGVNLRTVALIFCNGSWTQDTLMRDASYCFFIIKDML